MPILSVQSGCSGSGSRPTSSGATRGQGDEWHGDIGLARAELYLIQDPFATDLGCGGNLAGRKLEVCCLRAFLPGSSTMYAAADRSVFAVHGVDH